MCLATDLTYICRLMSSVVQNKALNLPLHKSPSVLCFLHHLQWASLPACINCLLNLYSENPQLCSSKTAPDLKTLIQPSFKVMEPMYEFINALTAKGTAALKDWPELANLLLKEGNEIKFRVTHKVRIS